MAEVTYTAKDLNNYTKKQLIDMFLEKESTDNSLSELTCQIQKLTSVVTRLESEISIVRRVNHELQRQHISTERQFWANAQYSRRECVEVAGIPLSVPDGNLEKKSLKFLINWVCQLMLTTSRLAIELKQVLIGP